MTRYLYRPTLRQATFGGAPHGWEYVEVPRSLASTRPDLPVSANRYGVISYPAPLSAEQRDTYDLDEVTP